MDSLIHLRRDVLSMERSTGVRQDGARRRFNRALRSARERALLSAGGEEVVSRDTLRKKGALRKFWKKRLIELYRECPLRGLFIRWKNTEYRIIGDYQVLGVSDIQDRRGKLANRFDVFIRCVPNPCKRTSYDDRILKLAASTLKMKQKWVTEIEKHTRLTIEDIKSTTYTRTIIGSGKYGTVYLLRTEYGYVVEKVIQVENNNYKQLYNELLISLELTECMDKGRPWFVRTLGTSPELSMSKLKNNIVNSTTTLLVSSVSIYMEYCQENFMEYIERHKKRGNNFINQVTEIIIAVGYLHKLGYLHLDLKPDNILMDVHGHIKLADFGVSCHYQYENPESADDQYGHKCLYFVQNKVGTMNYVHPSMYERGEANIYCDWWSVGKIIKKILGLKTITPKNIKNMYRIVADYLCGTIMLGDPFVTIQNSITCTWDSVTKTYQWSWKGSPEMNECISENYVKWDMKIKR